ncbi:hypothetical protein VTN77DRAFT_5810 [Rasamsonia byssochlamydoides]|uniref:uncharacterized protein n=1 Tax=Rasamsonia byssochlamydoides TaxID=89139 RepID=UPI0037430FFF
MWAPLTLLPSFPAPEPDFGGKTQRGSEGPTAAPVTILRWCRTTEVGRSPSMPNNKDGPTVGSLHVHRQPTHSACRLVASSLAPPYKNFPSFPPTNFFFPFLSPSASHLYALAVVPEHPFLNFSSILQRH